VRDDPFRQAVARSALDAAGQVIMSHIKVDGLAYWIDAVRKYHGQTYQHCLLVTGVAVSFGQKLGFCEADQRKLAFSALLHDIGKARIPIAILEKRSPLNPDENSAMKLHPPAGTRNLAKGARSFSGRARCGGSSS